MSKTDKVKNFREAHVSNEYYTTWERSSGRYFKEMTGQASPHTFGTGDD